MFILYSMATIQTLIPNQGFSDVNNIYYNIRIENDGSKLFQPANYSVNRTSPVVDKPNDYELAVVRFSVPASNIPIMVWGSLPFDPKTNPSSKINKFSVSMAFDGLTITKTLVFLQNSSGNDFYGDTIWNYQEFIDIINVGLFDAFTDLKVAKPSAPPTQAPQISYDPKTRLCSLYAEQTYNTGSVINLAPVVPTIRVYLNTELYSYFPSLQSFEQEENDPSAHQILIKNNFGNTLTLNGAPYFQMEQEYSTLALWNDFSTIVFETDSIPVSPEYQPTQNDTTRRLITDFEPLEDINNREQFQYFGSGWKRYYDLMSAYPLNTVDIKAYWEDKNGQLYPIYIGTHEVLTMKILFRKKLALQLEQSFGEYDD